MTALTPRTFIKIFIYSLLCAHHHAVSAAVVARQSAQELGVGPDGATTWLLPSGASGLDAPATLVLGPSTLGLSYVDPNLGMAIDENCAIADGVAACTVVDAAGGFTETVTTTEAVPSFSVQGDGAVATPSPTSNTPQADSPSTLASAGSPVDSLPSPSGSSAGSATPPLDGTSSSPVVTGSPAQTSAASSGGAGAAGTTQANGAMESKSLPFLSFAIAGCSIMYMVLA